jgi:hypothetical protein
VEGEEHLETRAITRTFGPDQIVSPGMKDVARLTLGARRLLLRGRFQAANTMMSQARTLMQTDPGILQAKELNKPLGREMLAETGMAPGSTMGDLMKSGLSRLRSPEEVSEARARGTAAGKAAVEAEGQLRLLNEGTILIDDLLEDIKLDPTIVGAGGSLRLAGQTATEVLSDLGGSKLVELARDVAGTDTDLGLDEIEEFFGLGNETLSVLGVLENSIGLILARIRQPSGRLLGDVVKRSIADVKLSGLTSSKQVVRRLNFLRKQLGRRSGALKESAGIPEEKPDDAGIPRFRIDEDGALVPVEQE